MKPLCGPPAERQPHPRASPQCFLTLCSSNSSTRRVFWPRRQRLCLRGRSWLSTAGELPASAPGSPSCPPRAAGEDSGSSARVRWRGGDPAELGEQLSSSSFTSSWRKLKCSPQVLLLLPRMMHEVVLKSLFKKRKGVKSQVAELKVSEEVCPRSASWWFFWGGAEISSL